MPIWLLLVIALGVAVVATSLNPSDAVARARPENTEPLAGDPTDTNDGPAPRTSAGATKSPALSRYSVGSDTGTVTPSATAQFRIFSWAGRLDAFHIGFLTYWRFTR